MWHTQEVGPVSERNMLETDKHETNTGPTQPPFIQTPDSNSGGENSSKFKIRMVSWTEVANSFTNVRSEHEF